MKILKWIFYWFITQDERHRYDIGKIEGKHCTGWDTNIFGRRYHFTSDKPKREFLTYKEFMSR